MGTKLKRTNQKASQCSRKSSAAKQIKKPRKIERARLIAAEKRAKRKEEINKQILSNKSKIGINCLVYGAIVCVYARKLNIRRFHIMALLIMGSTEVFSPVKCNQYFRNIFTERYFSDLTQRFVTRGLAHKVGKMERVNLFALTPKGRDLYEKIYKSIRRFMKKNYYGVHSWTKI